MRLWGAGGSPIDAGIEEFHSGIHLSVDALLLPAQRRFTRRHEGKLIKAMSSSRSCLTQVFKAQLLSISLVPDTRKVRLRFIT